MKKNKILLALITLSGLITGCKGSDNNFTTTIDKPWWKDSGEVIYDSEGNVDYDAQIIKLATVVGGEDKVALEEIIETFNREYQGKITVEMEVVGQEEYEDTLAKRISQNSNAPHLMMSHQKGHKNFVTKKLIQPFDEYFKMNKTDFSIDNFASNLGNDANLGYEGYTFNVPIDGQSTVLFYNKTLLQKHNGGVLPTTRSEFIELCKDVQEEERKTNSEFYALAMPSELDFYDKYLFPTAIVQNGGEFYDKETFRVNWTEEANKKAFKDAFTSIREFYHGENQIAEYGVSEAGAQNRFYENKSLFLLALPWNCPSIFEAYKTKNNISSITEVRENKLGGFSTAGIFALDSEAPYANKIFGDAHAFAIPKTVEDVGLKTAICEFVNYFTTNVNSGVIWGEAGHISGSQTIVNSEEYRNSYVIENYINEFYIDMNNFTTIGNTPYYSDTFREVQKLSKTMMMADNLDGKNDDKIIKAAEDIVNGIIDLGA